MRSATDSLSPHLLDMVVDLDAKTSASRTKLGIAGENWLRLADTIRLMSGSIEQATSHAVRRELSIELSNHEL